MIEFLILSLFATIPFAAAAQDRTIAMILYLAAFLTIVGVLIAFI